MEHDYVNDDADLLGGQSTDDDIMVMSRDENSLNTALLALSSEDSTGDTTSKKGRKDYINQEVVDQVANERESEREAGNYYSKLRGGSQ